MDTGSYPGYMAHPNTVQQVSRPVDLDETDFNGNYGFYEELPLREVIAGWYNCSGGSQQEQACATHLIRRLDAFLDADFGEETDIHEELELALNYLGNVSDRLRSQDKDHAHVDLCWKLLASMTALLNDATVK